MSDAQETEFDLEKLFLPAWAQGTPAANKYANFKGEEPRDRDRDRDRRPGRGHQRGGPRHEGGRPGGGGGERRPGFGRPPEGRGRPQGREGDRGRGPQRPPQETRAPEPLPALTVTILPDDKGVESVAKQIRMTGRAYPLFQIALLFLQKPERQQISIEVIKNAEGQPIQPLFHCALDDTIWLSEDEAVQHILNRHFATLYQAEKTPTDPPKGIYTFVAQCGMSGTILGPPNYHDYQNQLRRLHSERFSRLPFEAFKSRVKMVRDPEVVKKWIEDHSVKTEFLCLNVAETLKLPNREEVEKHFRSVHLPNLVKQVESYSMSGAAARQQRSPALLRALRAASDEQRHFPLKLATILSQKFAGHGLQFFKVNRTVTHVSVARPHYLDMDATPVSEGVRSIVQFIQTNPRTTRRKLLERLAPSPAGARPSAAPGAKETPTPDAGPAAANVSAETAPAAQAPAATPEQTALAADLHWLIHQGHVIEFANGILETAKKPLPKPPKPPAPNKAQPGASAETVAAPSEEAEVSVPEAPSESAEGPASAQTEERHAAQNVEESAAPPAEAADSQPADEQKSVAENVPNAPVAPTPAADQSNVLAS